MEKKEVPPGSGHFESSERSNVVQQDALNQLKLPARRTKFQKKDQCTWINDKCSESSSFFFLSQSKIQPQLVLLVHEKGFRDNRY